MSYSNNLDRTPLPEAADALRRMFFTNHQQQQQHSSSSEHPFLTKAPIEKKVRFAEREALVIPSVSPLDQINKEGDGYEQQKMVELICHNLWYQACDLDAFRHQARVICRQMRLLSQSNSNNEEDEEQQQQQRCSLAAADGATRGLEAKSCLERQRRKYLAGKCVVRAQSKLCPDRLAVLARKCTRWASLLAQEEALRDYARAQDSDTHNYDHDNGCRKKRTLSMDEDELFSDRRVRPRGSTT